MKVSYLSIGLLALLSPLTAAWSKEDREIFRIRDEISAYETDPAATFYDILGVPPSASHDDITKAYRQKTRSLHPDKIKQKLKTEGAKGKGKQKKPPSQAEVNAAVKEAGEAQARLSLIAKILRGPNRDRYDHFLAHGFPLWKGTDYYYNRYRPGLGTAVIGVFLLGGGVMHYLILYMSWKRQKEFLERYIKFARNAAWGSSSMNIPGVDSAPAPAPAPQADDDEEGPPQPMNRKQRRMQEQERKREGGRVPGKKARKAKSTSSSRDASAAPAGVRKRVVAENGKVLVVDSLGDVYLEEQDEEGSVNEFLLDIDELVRPTFKDTAIVRVPVWVLRSTFGRLLGKTAAAAEEKAEDQDVVDDDSDRPQRTPSSDSAGEDFELLDKSTDSLAKAAKATGAQKGGKPSKRKGKKR